MEVSQERSCINLPLRVMLYNKV